MSSSNPATTSTSGLAIACLVLGILTLLSFWMIYFVLVPGLLAIVLGILGLRQIRRETATGKGLAVAGIICATLGMIPTALLTGGLALALIFGEPVPPSDFAAPSPTATSIEGPATPIEVVAPPAEEGH